MPSESQASFFARLRAALRSDAEPATVVHGPPGFSLPESLEASRVVQPTDDLVGTFMMRATQAGMHPHRVQGESAVAAKVAEIVASLAAKTALVPAEDMLAREAILAALDALGVTLVDPDDPDAGFEADLGITGVRIAVAETASMSVVSGGGHRRLASLAVPAHLAILDARSIVPDLLDWGRQTAGPGTANEVLISAMSKTADIEGILVAGVHGPRIVHVIVME